MPTRSPITSPASPCAFDEKQVFITPFAERYAESIASHSKREFLVFYSAKDEKQVLSFSEFDLLVQTNVQTLRRLANKLRIENLSEHRVPSPQMILATLSENHVSQLVSAVAALLAGFVYCPIHIDDSEERIMTKLQALRSPLQEVGAGPISCVLLWGSELAQNKFPTVKFDRVFGHREAVIGPSLAALQSHDDRASALTPSQEMPDSKKPFILVFTSGSTGHSKIVEQTECGLLTNIEALNEHYQLGPGEVIATPLSTSHVNALEFSFFCALFSGAKVLLFEHFSLHAFACAVQDQHATLLSVIPGILRLLVDSAARLPTDWCRSVKYAVTAAAPLPKSLVIDAAKAFHFRLLQGYGLSEIINFSALMPVNLSEAEHSHWMTGFSRPSVGTAVRGNEILIVDDSGAPVPPDTTGSVLIRGMSVMRGYRGSADACPSPNDYFHTGDLGSYALAPNGLPFYFIHGRVKEIVKRYGRTVSLVEVDELLSEVLSETFSAISVGFQHNLASEEIGLVVASSLNASELSAQLHALMVHLKTKLHESMRPRVVVLTADPLRTLTGKARRWDFDHLFVGFHSQILTSEPTCVPLSSTLKQFT